MFIFRYEALCLLLLYVLYILTMVINTKLEAWFVSRFSCFGYKEVHLYNTVFISYIHISVSIDIGSYREAVVDVVAQCHGVTHV